MSDQPPEFPDWEGYTVIALFFGVILAMFLASSSYDPLRITGLIMLGAIAVGLVFGYIWLIDSTASDSRNVSHLDSGMTVIALTDFSVESGVNRGKVNLAGELWDSICQGDCAPRKGDELLVIRRDVRHLVVSRSDDGSTLNSTEQD